MMNKNQEKGPPTGKIILSQRPDGDRKRIVVESENDAFLVLREYLLEGWHAKVDGKQTPIYFADGIGRAVFETAGRHEVIFEFKPRNLFWGFAVSATTLMAMAAAILISGFSAYPKGPEVDRLSKE